MLQKVILQKVAYRARVKQRGPRVLPCEVMIEASPSHRLVGRRRIPSPVMSSNGKIEWDGIAKQSSQNVIVRAHVILLGLGEFLGTAHTSCDAAPRPDAKQLG